MSTFRDKNGRFISDGKRKRLTVHQENPYFKKRLKVEEFESSLEGRRIVEIGYLAEQLWCRFCNISLSLRDVESEFNKGLASIFSVRCSKCLSLKKILTSKKVLAEEGKGCYDLYAVNCKAAAACLHSGTGHDQFNKLLMTMNIQPVSTDTLQRSQKRITAAVLQEAHESCIKAIHEEKSLTEAELNKSVKAEMMKKEKRSPDSSVRLIPLWSPLNSKEISFQEINTVVKTVSIISARVNSLSGLCSAGEDKKSAILLTSAQIGELVINESFLSSIGLLGPVILASSYDFAWFKRGNGRCYNSKCGQGTVFGKRSKKIIAYDTISTECRKCKIGTCKPEECRKNFTGSAKAMEPYAAVRLIVKNENLTNANVKIGVLIGDDDSSTINAVQREADHPVHKVSDMNHIANSFGKKLWAVKKKYKELTQNVIKYFKKGFSYAIQQNKGDVEGVADSLLNIAEHAFGNHKNCKNWCGYRKDPDSYKHKYFSGGEPLKDTKLKEELKTILQIYADRAEQLAPCGSSQLNESFNQCAVTKAPKSRYYGGSVSNHLRVSCAVSQKNTGESYIVNQNKKACLSPGKITEKYTAQSERIKKRKNFRETFIKNKRRRLQLKQKNSDSHKERKEGFSYRSSMAVDGVTVPEPVPKLTENNLQDAELVIVDIETTGLLINDDIIQIAAINGENQFERFMMPAKPIPLEITNLTGIEVVNGQLKSLGKIVETKSPLNVANDFIDYLKSFNKPIVLVGHNIKRFDSPRIVKWLTKCKKIEEFYAVVYGLCDTLELIGKGYKSKKQDNLAKQCLTDEKWVSIIKNSHNALVDCQILQGLLDHFQITTDDIIKNSKSFSGINNEKLQNCDIKKRQETLKVLKPKVSVTMINKMAKVGIDLKMIKDALKKGMDAVSILLGENVGGKPRVTTSKKIINNVIEALTAADGT